MWAHSRSASTAFLRMMIERGDVTVVHEPFLALTEEGAVTLPTSAVARSFKELLALLAEMGRERPVFVKEVLDYEYTYLLDHPEELAPFTHTFMIRDPRRTIASHYAAKPTVTSPEIGYERLWELYALVSAGGCPPLVLRAERLLADPAGGGQLVGVPGGRGVGDLVDPGEDQCGQLHQGLGGQPRLDGGGGQLAPGDPGPDPVRRQQRLGGPTAAGLAAAELVGALHARPGRLVGVGQLAGGDGEEPAQGDLHRGLDGQAHLVRPRALVGGYLVDYRRDHVLADAGQDPPQPLDDVGRKERCGSRSGHSLSPANKCDADIHVR